ncbi:MAG: hypothetical protein NTW21_14375 [Verrucomicrobia bacterium]|nr:hypothetical protein [Verrucomicrobiota bacterium]
MRGTNLGTFALADESTTAYSVPFRMHEHFPVGAATLALSDPLPTNKLLIGNIGSSGQDGVDIALPASNSVTITPGDVDGDGIPDLAVGGALDLNALGLRESPTTQSLVRTHIARAAIDQVVCDADFSDLGSTALMAGVYSNGQLLAEVPASSFSFGGNNPVPSSITISVGGSCDRKGNYHLWIDISFARSVPGSITVNGTTYLGDKVEIMSEDSPFVNGHVTVLKARVTNPGGLPPGTFALADEATTPYSVPFRMHDHFPVGAATLALTDKNPTNRLLIGNLGSSGQDGVDIALPKANSVWIQPGDVDGDGVPDFAAGGTLDLTAVGFRESPTKQSLIHVHAARGSSGAIDYTADFSGLNSFALMTQVYNNGALVGEASGGGATFGGSDPVASRITIEAGASCDLNGHYHLWCKTIIGRGVAGSITVGGTTYIGDRVEIMSEDSPFLNAYLTDLQVRGTGLGTFAFADEGVTPYSVPFRMHDHFPVGAATLALSDPNPTNRLLIGNLGSSGQDGVDIALPKSNSVWIQPGDVDGDGVPDFAAGGTLDLTAVGFRESPTKQSLIRVHAARGSSGAIDYTADFSGLNSFALMTQVYNNGALVDETSGGGVTFGGSDPVAKTITITGAGSCDFNGHYHLWVVVTVERSVAGPITVGGKTIVGDKVEIMSEDSPFLNAYITDLQVRGTGLGIFALADEGVTPYSVPFRMHEHTPTGAATLAMSDPSPTNQLLVGNLGSSGQDGVDIAAGPVGSFDLAIGDLDGDGHSDLAVGGTLDFDSYGFRESPTLVSLPPPVKQKLTGLHVSRPVGEVVCTADFSGLDSSALMAEVYRDGVLLASVPASSFSFGDYDPATFDWSDPVPRKIRTSVGGSCDLNGHYHLWIKIEVLRSAAGVVIVNGTEYYADRVEIMSEDSVLLNAKITEMRLRGTSLGTFAIADETTTPWSIPFRMHDHFPVGAAEPALTSPLPTNQLFIGNLGSSGQDGVDIVTGRVGGVRVAMGDVTGDGVRDLAVGGSLDFDYWGVRESPTLPSQKLSGLHVSRTAADACVCTADFSGLGSTALMADIYRNGQLLAQVDASSVIFGGTDPVPASARWSGEASCNIRTKRYHLWITIELARAAPGPVTVGGVEYDADRVSIMSEDSQFLNAYMTELQVRGTNPGTIAFADESTTPYTLPFGMNDHTPLGSAQLAFTAPDPTGERRLEVSNIGSSGMDGVSIDLGRAEAAFVAFSPLDADPAVGPGAFLEATARGSLNGVSNQSLGTVRVTQTTDGFLIAPDFGPIHSPTHRVVVLSGGTVVADLPGQSGGIMSSRWPKWLGKLGGILECFVMDYVLPTHFTVGGSVVVGDEIRMLAEPAPGTIIDYKSAFEFRAAGMPMFEITEEVITEQAPLHIDLSHSAAGDSLRLSPTVTNQAYEFETCDDLEHWTVLSVQIAPGTSLTLDVPPSTSPKKFYRARESTTSTP